MKQITLFLLALSFVFTAQAQTKITGTISDNEDLLIGVNIIIKGTKTGTITNLDGYFEIEAKPNDTLSISYLGYATKEIVVGKQKTINTTLEVDNALDEVVLIHYSIRSVCHVLICNETISIGCGARGLGVLITQEKALVLNQSTLYPNPSATGYFNLKLLKNYNKVQVQVANISGQIIQSQIFQNINKSVRLDLSKYPSGIYIINIIADGDRLPTKKAIIG